MSTLDPLSPTVDDVAALIRARTKDSNGAEIGTFNDDTRPTAAQAQEAITHAVRLLHSAVGAVGPGCTDLAQMVAAYGAAAEIELSYYPEQARKEMSPYSYLLSQYEQYLQGLVSCIEGNLPSTPDPDDPDLQMHRYGTFDAISGTVAGYYTGRRWPALPNLNPNPTEVVDGGSPSDPGTGVLDGGSV
jgi:hypothetical protein